MIRLAPLRRAALLAMLVAAPAIAQTVAAQTISAAEFAARRDSLAARIDSGVVVAYGGRTLVHDFGTFFQLPAFHYLTSLTEPDAAFVMVVRQKKGQSTLFLAPTSVRMAFFYGKRVDSAGSKAATGIQGRPIASLPAVLDSLATSGLPFYTLADFESADFARADTLTRGQVAIRGISAKHPGLVVRDAHEIVAQLRARKTPAEIALIRKAAEISAEGHRAAMLVADPRHEYELRAALEYTFTRLGAERPAYGSIVGAGANGTQLHYMKDMGPARLGDVVVIDAAAEYRGYAADVTRTIPVSGTYTTEQRQIYQLVRDAQEAAERNAKPGLKASAAQDSSVVVRVKGLAALGLTQGADSTFDPPWRVNCEQQRSACLQSNLWMMHGISHGLGLEVHDPYQGEFGDGTYKVGDAFVLEPGLYISSRTLDALPDTPKNRAFIAAVKNTVKKYENTAVRIEDSYVITEKGLERISAGVPREIAEIEALMKKRARITP
jgi:Xaa-Pro aminopeptidase